MADPTDAQIGAMSNREKLAAMLNAVLPKVPADVAAQVRQLLTPQALHVIEGVIVVWRLSHFFGFGEGFDPLVLAPGVVALGADAVSAAKLAMEAFLDTRRARTVADIDAAAEKLARAIAVVGIDMLATLLFRWRRPNVPQPTRIGELFLGPIKIDDDVYYAFVTPEGDPIPGQRRQAFGDAFDARRMDVAGRR